jgi:hypothetical protein
VIKIVEMLILKGKADGSCRAAFAIDNGSRILPLLLTSGKGVQGVSTAGAVDGGDDDPNGVSNTRSLTPFGLAMGLNAVEAATAFLKNSETIGLDLNALDPLSFLNPLHLAATFGNVDVIKALVMHGGDKMDVDTASGGRDGLDAIGLAIQGNHTAVVRYLVEEAGARGTRFTLSFPVSLFICVDMWMATSYVWVGL